MEVNVYCYLSAPTLEGRNAQAYLEAFLSDISGTLQAVGQAFLFVWERSCLAPEPNDLCHSFVDGDTLLLPFSFQYFCLRQAYLRIELLQSLMNNLAYGKGIEVDFEYHLDG
ncbi:MAG TPA: hypothetical protein H9937_04035 [Candidatus Alistipes stercorigallinarum]|nr:hypothetical protein [Candidatus Alistipes stercorigallinarum]